MKRFILKSLVLASAIFVSVGTASAIDTYSAGDSASGIGQSRHNLGSLGNPNNSSYISTGNTSEVCVFCHTPHHTNTANNLKPLWNRGTLAPTAFTAYGSTIGGSDIANTDIGSTTLACLSCHDGVTTFDNLANKPGKGMSAATQGVAADLGWTFTKGPGGTATDDFISPTGRLGIGTNLSNDHPVSVAYATDRASLRATNTVISAIDLTADLAASSSTFDNGNLAKNLWAVNGFISNTATIGDLLRGGKVECSSCHDPHFSNKSYNEVDSTWGAAGELISDGMFLRRVGGNSGSGVCMTCHYK
ncbi:MAG TPA: hypothetical protein DCY86_14305 [Bdellovibrionales bacterium]|nr:hypothetical protein [Bdellovibrionales bacterium]